jgi:hypothetical protein
LRLIYVALSLLICFYLADIFAVQSWNPVWHTTQITSGGGCTYPWVYNSRVVYTQLDRTNNQFDVFYWNGNSTTRITNTPFNESSATLWENEMAWQGYTTPNKADIFFRDSFGVQHQISNTPEYQDQHAVVWNGKVVWDAQTSTPEHDVLYWDGTNTYRFHTLYQSNTKPFIDNDKVAWIDCDPIHIGAPRIKMWDGSTERFISDITNTISYFAFDGFCSAWRSSPPTRIEYWNGTNITQIYTSFQTGDTSVSKGFIAFEGIHQISGVWKEDIYIWRNGKMIQVTDDFNTDDQISVWFGNGKVEIAYRRNLNGVRDIMYSWAAIPEPSAFALISASIPLYSFWILAKRKK